MTDRELLEMAAKAAGISIDPIDAMHDPSEWVCWNPLTDDGDESRLESRCGLNVLWGDSSVTVANYTSDVGCTEFFDEHGDDRQMARRTAGVRAAAEIGKVMP